MFAGSRYGSDHIMLAFAHAVADETMVILNSDIDDDAKGAAAKLAIMANEVTSYGVRHGKREPRVKWEVLVET